MWTCFFARDEVYDYPTAKKADTGRFARVHRGLLERGVYLPPSQFEAAFLSSEHGAQEIEATVTAFRRRSPPSARHPRASRPTKRDRRWCKAARPPRRGRASPSRIRSDRGDRWRVLRGPRDPHEGEGRGGEEEECPEFSVSVPVREPAGGKVQDEIRGKEVRQRKSAEEQEVRDAADQQGNRPFDRSRDLPEGFQALGAKAGAVRMARASEQVAGRPSTSASITCAV